MQGTTAFTDEVSLRTAGLLVGKSVKTMQRWCMDEKIVSRVVDLRGKIMVPLSALLPYTAITMAERAWVLSADSGDGEAQNELGIIFLQVGKPDIAVGWFEEAAANKNADAMCWLAKSYFSGNLGRTKDEAAGLKWLALAAQHGHVIAKAQIESLLRRPGH